MTLTGVAVLPSAPLLVPGVTATLPDRVAPVCDAIDAVVERFGDPEAVVLAAPGDAWSLHVGSADLAGLGRPDVVRQVAVEGELLETLAKALAAPVTGGPLPLDLAVLVLLLGTPPATVALSVPVDAAFDDLAAAGGTIAATLAARDGPVVVVTTGDLAAGHGEAAPRYAVEGADRFDARVVDAVDSGRLDALASLGPGEAARVGARSWASLALLHGVLARSKLGLVRRLYAAPRGVGYLVAHGA